MILQYHPNRAKIIEQLDNWHVVDVAKYELDDVHNAITSVGPVGSYVRVGDVLLFEDSVDASLIQYNLQMYV